MANFFAALGGAILTYGIVSLICYVLLIIAQWKIFTKAGEPGWKSLIPVYNAYIQFKITWNTKMFWVFLGCAVLMSIFSSFDNGFCSVLAALFSIALFVLYILENNKLAKSFGHGVGYTILLIFFPNIMTLILGFGKDKYIGPQ